MTHSSSTPAVSPSRWGLGIFLLGLVVALAMVFVGFRNQTLVQDKFDPYFFGEMGKSLARGEGFAKYGVLLMRRSPLYPAMIGGLYFLFGEHALLVQLAQALLLAGTCWLVFDMGRRVFNLRTGILAGIACVFHPMMLRYVADLHLETLLTFLFTLAIWCSVRFYYRPTIATGAQFGAAVGAAALTKAVVVLYPAVFVGAWILARLLDARQRAESRFSIAAALAIFVTMGAVIAPWTIRNYYATNGHFVLISSGFNDAMLRGYVFSQTDYALLRRPPYTDAENASNAWFEALCREAGTKWQRDDYETEQILSRAAKAKLRAEPGEFVRKFVVGLFTFWYQMTSRINSVLTGTLALGAWLLAWPGIKRAIGEGRPVWMFIAPALYLNLLLAALLALGRYSAPILPALLVASAYGVDTLLTRFAPRRG